MTAVHDLDAAIDMSTTYLGLQLRSPIVASASPMTGNPRMWDRLERAGAGAIVLPSLFEEQIEREIASFDSTLAMGCSAEATDFLPALDQFDVGPGRHIALVEQASAQLTIPVIASINGISPRGWVQYARRLAEAGADAIELNLYDLVVDPQETAEAVERRYLELVQAIRAEISVPLAVKLCPWFTALANFAGGLERAGAAGLVLFNRLYQPDIDLETLEVKPHLQLSSSLESLLPLSWIAILRNTVAGTTSLAATGGVEEGADALKLLLAGADVVMTTSALLRHGPEHIAVMLQWLSTWLSEHEYTGVRQVRGSLSRGNVGNPGVYQRVNYYQTLHSWVTVP